MSSLIGVGCPLAFIRAAIERDADKLNENDRKFLTEIERQAREDQVRLVDLPSDIKRELTRILASDEIYPLLYAFPQPETD